jgi:hypothetical protein
MARDRTDERRVRSNEVICRRSFAEDALGAAFVGGPAEMAYS